MKFYLTFYEFWQWGRSFVERQGHKFSDQWGWQQKFTGISGSAIIISRKIKKLISNTLQL